MFNNAITKTGNRSHSGNGGHIGLLVITPTKAEGIYTDAITTPTSHIGQANMQAYVNSLASSYNSAWFETRTSTAANGGYYTNTIFPTGTATGTSLSALAYAYYDDYFMTEGTTANFSYVTQSDTHLPGEETATTAKIKGMPTIVTQTTVGAGIAANTWLTTVTFYDHNLHPIQVQSNNQMYYTGYITQAELTDTKTVAPDFLGMPLYSKVAKKTSATVTTTVYSSLVYDPVYRVQNVSQIYNTGSYTQVAAYNYNELGQVIKKGLGYVSSTAWLQNVNFRYSIRGQLLNINNSKLANDTGKTSNDTNDLFGMQMLYDKVDTKLNNTPCYNGQLSAVKWMSKDGSNNSSYERAFNYYYDALNRDTAAVYNERPTASTAAFTNTNGWNENRITYDQNGNLLTLFRDEATQALGNHVPIDNLTYTYSTSSPNQLLTVADATGNSAGFVGGAGGNYMYDANGNQMNDAYKGITKITYNVLNRTDSIKLSSTQYITYTYDASGNLIRKQAYKSGATTQITDYIDGFVYNNLSGSEILSYFPMPEGRVLYNGTSFSQEFIITDQQGNARVSFNNTGTGGAAKVAQENSYYAFGLIMPGSTVGTTGASNKQLYNGGSEWQNDYSNMPDYYQTFNRNYDAALARWIGVDPAAESAESMSSYQYAGNNPIMFNDPLGDLLPYPGSHDPPPYQNVGNDFGGLPSDIQENINSFYAQADGGAYGANPGYYTYLGMTGQTSAGGQNIYHASTGVGDPATGMTLAQLSLSITGQASVSDILAPYAGHDVGFSEDGSILFNEENPGLGSGIVAMQQGSPNTGQMIGQAALIELLLNLPPAGDIDPEGDSLFGATETVQNGARLEINDGWLMDKFEMRTYANTTIKGNEGLLNINHNLYTDQYSKIYHSADVNMSFLLGHIRLTSSAGVLVDVGDGKDISIDAGLSLLDGITIGGTVNGKGFDASFRPGVLSILGGVAVVVGVFAF